MTIQFHPAGHGFSCLHRPEDVVAGDDTELLGEFTHPHQAFADEIRAAMSTWTVRRFVFYELHESAESRRKDIVGVLGLRLSTGHVLLSAAGHPFGWYPTMDDAWHATKRDKHRLWIVWLDPAPARTEQS